MSVRCVFELIPTEPVEHQEHRSLRPRQPGSGTTTAGRSPTAPDPSKAGTIPRTFGSRVVRNDRSATARRSVRLGHFTTVHHVAGAGDKESRGFQGVHRTARLINKVSGCASRLAVTTPPVRCCHSPCMPTPARRRCATSPIEPHCPSHTSNRSCSPSREPASCAPSAVSAAATCSHGRPRRSCCPRSCRPSTGRSRSATSANPTRTGRATTRANACCSASGTRPARRCAHYLEGYTLAGIAAIASGDAPWP